MFTGNIKKDGPLAVSRNEQVPMQQQAVMEHDRVAATRSLLSLAAASESNDSNHQQESRFATLDNEEDSDIDDTKLWGLTLEYAAGIALRNHILEPVLREVPNASRSETTQFLGMASRGDHLFIGNNGSVQSLYMKRICKEDATMFQAWWEDDKFLPHTDQAWSDWWVRRSHLFDPGCEMYKLVMKNDDEMPLGVVYFERNIVDKHEFEVDGGVSGRITLIRGMRVAPSFNPQVTRRRNLTYNNNDTESSNGEMYDNIISLLFSHVLYMSVRYGSNAVGVNCPKTPEAERFYYSQMGAPVGFDDSGRRYHRLESEERWKVLRESFQRKVELRLSSKQG